jgi:acylphosphatase
MESSKKFLQYEVFGKVQGVFFRKHTKTTADSLGLVGWVMNTDSATVVGQAAGPPEKIQKFSNWLCKVGSPKSRIDKCDTKASAYADQ